MKNFLLFFVIGLVSAQQPALQRITPENAYHLEVLETLGRGRVTDAGWTADGQTLVVASATGLWLYDADDLSAEPRFLTDQHGWIRSMAIHPEWLLVATGHDDGAIVVWDLETNREEAVLWGHDHPVIGLAYSPDGWWLLSFSSDETFGYGSNRPRDQMIRIWQDGYNTDYKVLRTIILNYMDVDNTYADYKHLAISPDNKIIFIGGLHSGLDYTSTHSILYDFDTGAVIENGSWNIAAFSPDNQFILFPGGLFDRTTGQQKYFNDYIFFNDAAFNADSSMFATVGGARGEMQAIGVWDTATGTNLMTFGGDAEATKVAFRPGDRQLVSIHVDETVRVWDVATGNSLAVLSGFTGAVDDIAFSGNSQLLAIARWYTGMTLWNIQEKAPDFELNQPYIYGIAISPDNRWLAYAIGIIYYGNTVYLMNMDTKQSHLFSSQDRPDLYNRPLTEWGRFFDPPEGLTFSPDGKKLAWTTNYLYVWDVAQGEPVWMPEMVDEFELFAHATFHPDGNIVAMYEAWYGGIHVLDASTGEMIAKFEGRDVYRAVAFSKDGTMLAASSMETGMGSEATVIVWDTETQTILFKHNDPFNRHDWSYPDLAFGPDGRLLAYSSDDGNITLLDVATWETVTVIDGQQGIPEEIEFSEDGTLLAAGYSSGVVLLWGIE